MKQCPSCHNIIEDHVNFCPGCGADLRYPNAPAGPKDNFKTNADHGGRIRIRITKPVFYTSVIIMGVAFIAVIALMITSTIRMNSKYDLGMEYYEAGQYEEAVVAFTAAIETVGHNTADAYVGRANAYYALGGEDNLKKARDDYEMAIKTDSEYEEAYWGLVNVYIAMEKYENALETLDDLKKILDDDTEVDNKIEEVGALIEQREAQKYETAENSLNELLAEQMQDLVTSDYFLTSSGTELYSFSTETNGLVNGVVVDIDFDSWPELISLYCNDCVLTAVKYEIDESGNITETELGTVGELTYCSQMEVMLYYNQANLSYCLAIYDTYVGAYTGAGGFDAKIYSVDNNGLHEQVVWSWNSLINGWDELDGIQSEMTDWEWPYLNGAYFSAQTETSLSSCAWLLRTEINITDGMMPTEYVRYMRFYSPDELSTLP